MSSFNPFTHPGLTDFNSPLGMLEWIWLNRPESPPRMQANTAAQVGASNAGNMAPLQLDEDTLSEEGDDDQEDLDNEKIFDCLKFEDHSEDEGDATPDVASTSSIAAERELTGSAVGSCQSDALEDGHHYPKNLVTESGEQATAIVSSNGGEHNTAAEPTDATAGEPRDEERTDALEKGVHAANIVDTGAVDVHTDASVHAIAHEVSSEPSGDATLASTTRSLGNGKGKEREREIDMPVPTQPSTIATTRGPSIHQYSEAHIRTKRSYDETFEGALPQQGAKRARMDTLDHPFQAVAHQSTPGYAAYGPEGAHVTAHTPEAALGMGHPGCSTPRHGPGYQSYLAHTPSSATPYISQAPPPMGYPVGQFDHRYYGYHAYPMHKPSPVSYQLEHPGTWDRRNLGYQPYQMPAPSLTIAWAMPPQSHYYPPAVCSYAPTLAAPQPQMAASTSQASIIHRTSSTSNYWGCPSHSFAQPAAYPYPSNPRAPPYTAASSPAGSSRSTPSIEDQQPPKRVTSAPPVMVADIPVAPARDWDQVPFTSRRAKGSRRIASNSRVRAQVAGSSSSASLTTIPEDQDAGAPPEGGNVSFRTSTQNN